MSQIVQLELGKVYVSPNVIAKVCGIGAMETVGLVGMASRNVGDGISELLRIDSLERGIDIQYHEDSLTVRLYIVVQYGTRISEVARNVQERVKYAVENRLGLKAHSIDIHVQGVRVAEGRRK